ncbi:MAG: hypothetical protein KJO36_08760 [Acidimicrobiia bacterium]|nr:hypothetical protein [Acidimicrobiia bacterium]MBT8248828.1 hypothetical protein [Acidimicrobiia bacterium]NND13554.1 hypothetical protein [Acidimicrobiia bacterium]NNL27002.1 hypothetical protein [Acidimicrobiia bacterium]NNL48438.1 hypothetical protein [Acidimicrobiia bacterium]
MNFDRIDRLGGRLVARFWGTLLLLGVLGIGMPMLIGSIVSGAWAGAVFTGIVSAVGLAIVGFLFSSRRRLSDLD